MMEIRGFTPLEMELADRIWTLDSPEAVEQFKRSLPRSLRPAAETVHQMIIAEAIDELVGDYPDLEMANKVIEMVK